MLYRAVLPCNVLRCLRYNYARLHCNMPVVLQKAEGSAPKDDIKRFEKKVPRQTRLPSRGLAAVRDGRAASPSPDRAAGATGLPEPWQGSRREPPTTLHCHVSRCTVHSHVSRCTATCHLALARWTRRSRSTTVQSTGCWP